MLAFNEGMLPHKQTTKRIKVIQKDIVSVGHLTIMSFNHNVFFAYFYCLIIIGSNSLSSTTLKIGEHP